MIVAVHRGRNPRNNAKFKVSLEKIFASFRGFRGLIFFKQLQLQGFGLQELFKTMFAHFASNARLFVAAKGG
jgi:hypothetical protein